MYERVCGTVCVCMSVSVSMCVCGAVCICSGQIPVGRPSAARHTLAPGCPPGFSGAVFPGREPPTHIPRPVFPHPPCLGVHTGHTTRRGLQRCEAVRSRIGKCPDTEGSCPACHPRRLRTPLGLCPSLSGPVAPPDDAVPCQALRQQEARVLRNGDVKRIIWTLSASLRGLREARCKPHLSPLFLKPASGGPFRTVPVCSSPQNGV